MRRNIVEAYESLYPGHGGKSAALREMNAALGSNCDLSRLGAYRRGDRVIPRPVERYMRDRVLSALAAEVADSVFREISAVPGAFRTRRCQAVCREILFREISAVFREISALSPAATRS